MERTRDYSNKNKQPYTRLMYEYIRRTEEVTSSTDCLMVDTSPIYAGECEHKQEQCAGRSNEDEQT